MDAAAGTRIVIPDGNDPYRISRFFRQARQVEALTRLAPGKERFRYGGIGLNDPVDFLFNLQNLFRRQVPFEMVIALRFFSFRYAR